jgi:hypothetical protein
VAILADRSVTPKGTEKEVKYKSLCTVIQGMWNTKRKIIPVINGAKGIVTKGMKETLEAIPGNKTQM